MKRYSMPFGRTIGYNHDHPDRTARKSGAGLSGAATVTFQVWPNRASMAKTIRMQEQRESRYDDWHALVPLGVTEGY